MPLVAVVDSVLSKTIQLEQIDAQFAVSKYPARYTYAAAPLGPLDPVTITPGASPFVYSNNTTSKMTVMVQGGAVSKIEQGRKGTFIDCGHIAGGILLSAGDQLRVTYFVAPTMTAFPLV
jgi:hypothetical protein